MTDQQGLNNSQNNLTDSTVIIGEIKGITGNAIATSENGSQRILREDDNVFKNDRIKVISGTVHIEFFEGNAFINLGEGDNALLDESVYLSEPNFVPDSVIDAKSIIAAIDLGADPTKILPPTAAGPKPSAAPAAIEENEGSPGFPIIDRDGNSTIAESGFDTGTFVGAPIVNLVDDEEEIIPNNPEPPVTPPEPPVTPPPVINNNKFNLPENSVSGTEVGKVEATGSGKLTFKFENGTQTSKDGFFTIDAVTGVISLTALGAATNTNGHGLLDFESQPNMDTVQVTVMDENGNSTTQAVDICITDVNEPPTIDLYSDLTVLEDCIDTSSPIKIGTLSAVDPDGNFDRYIISGEDADLVEVMGNMIQLKPGVMLEVGTINISIVGVDEGGLTSNQVDFSVDVIATEVPEIISNKFNLKENSDTNTVVGEVEVNSSTPVTYSFENGLLTSPNGYFSIDATTGVITLTADGAATNDNGLLNFECYPNMDSVWVTVTNQAGKTDTQEVKICITDVNEPPTIDLYSDLTVLEDCVDTSSPIKIGTLKATDPDGNFDRYIISGEDADLVEIMGDMIQLKPGVMLEVGTINISIVGIDEGGLTSNKVDFSVDVLDTKKPEIENDKFDLKENSSAKTVVGKVEVTDSSSVKFSFENGTQTSNDGYFSINAVTGVIILTALGAQTNANGLLDFESQPNMDILRVSVEDEAGNKTTQDVTICITDVNEPPTIDLYSDLTVLEDCADTSCGILIGTLSATDPDDNFDHYEITGDDKDLVEIQGNELRIKPNVVLDSDTNPEISVSIIGVDQGGLKSNQVDFSVDVIDTNNPITQADSYYFPAIGQNSSSYPKISTIEDFNTCEGDCLNLKDLLIDEENNPIDDYLAFSFNSGSTTIDVSPEANGAVKQQIVLKDVDLSAQYGTADTSAILNNLLDDNNLIVDV